jgi:hypothetical protein
VGGVASNFAGGQWLAIMKKMMMPTKIMNVRKRISLLFLLSAAGQYYRLLA